MRVATLAVRRGRGPRHRHAAMGRATSSMPSAPPLPPGAAPRRPVGLQGFGTAAVQIAQDIGNAVTPARSSQSRLVCVCHGAA